jgi:hypothetical protein
MIFTQVTSLGRTSWPVSRILTARITDLRDDGLARLTLDW